MLLFPLTVHSALKPDICAWVISAAPPQHGQVTISQLYSSSLSLPTHLTYGNIHRMVRMQSAVSPSCHGEFSFNPYFLGPHATSLAHPSLGDAALCKWNDSHKDWNGYHILPSSLAKQQAHRNHSQTLSCSFHKEKSPSPWTETVQLPVLCTIFPCGQSYLGN